MNKVALLGRLTKDPEVVQTKSGKKLATFTLAVEKPMSKEQKKEAEANGKPTADFIRVQVWGAFANNVIKYLGKGCRCSVVGRIQVGSYEDKDTGKTIYTTNIFAENVEFIDFKGNQSKSSLESDDFFDDEFSEIEDDKNIPF